MLFSSLSLDKKSSMLSGKSFETHSVNIIMPQFFQTFLRCHQIVTGFLWNCINSVINVYSVYIIWWLKISTERHFLGLNHLRMLNHSSRTGKDMWVKTIRNWNYKRNRGHNSLSQDPGNFQQRTNWSLIFKDFGALSDDFGKETRQRHISKVATWMLSFKKIFLAQEWRELGGRPIWKLLKLDETLWAFELSIGKR